MKDENAKDMNDDERELLRGLREAATTRMPFGKFGPAGYPPEGVLLCDLPYEYLRWFEQKRCFPSGRLGELMRLVMQLKRDGAEGVFAQLREEPRPSLRQRRTRIPPLRRE